MSKGVMDDYIGSSDKKNWSNPAKVSKAPMAFVEEPVEEKVTRAKGNKSKSPRKNRGQAEPDEYKKVQMSMRVVPATYKEFTEMCDFYHVTHADMLEELIKNYRSKYRDMRENKKGPFG